MATSPDWLDWTIKIIAPLLAGIVGVVIGSQLTTWRERWDLRRDLYFELLRAMIAASHSYGRIEFALKVARAAAEDVKVEARTALRSALDRAGDANERFRQACVTAEIIVPPSISRLLKEIDSDAGEAATEAGGEKLRWRLRELIDAAVPSIQREARRDLLGMAGWNPIDESHDQQSARAKREN